MRLDFAVSGVDDGSHWAIYQMGYAVAHKGEAAVLDTLTHLKHQIGAPWDGPKRKYGALYGQLSFDLTGADYAPFRTLLREHILETWALGPSDELMGEPVLRRRKHSVI